MMINDTGIDLREVRKNYDQRDKIWDPDDLWHMAASKRYDREIRKFLASYGHDGNIVINIGSGDKKFDSGAFLVNIDLSTRFLGGHSNPVCASAGSVPLKDASSDAVLCVGSVINYCNASEVLSEIRRILRPGGRALIEFESSESFEYYGTDKFGQAATIVVTKYDGGPERIWLYKPAYLRNILNEVGLTVVRTGYLHVLSAIVFWMTKRENISSLFCVYDRLTARTPLKRFAHNQFFVCERV
jgi:SAM-dependent methyltransferase